MSRSRFLSVAALLFAATALVSCTGKDWDNFSYKAQNSVKQDREKDYDRDDFRNAMAPRPVDPSEKNSASDKVPDLAPVIAEDKKNILPQPLVSITVNQDVPIRDIFFELAKQAEVDLELDPTITGSIIFTAYNRPFDQVVQRISDMAGLRYTFKNNVLRVERDTPYLKTYRVDYISMTRDYTSTINSNTSAASAAGGSSGGGNNGSSSAITTKSSADFWKDLGDNITQIIGNTNQQVSLTDQSAPIATPNAIPAVSTAQLANVAGATPAAAVPVPGAPAVAGSSAPPVAGLMNPTGTQTVAGGTTDGAATVALANPYFSINKSAGLINIFATEKQHEKVGHYLAELRRSTNSQVLIEAKVFEVELNDESTTGIDWTAVLGNVSIGPSLPRENFPEDQVLSSTGGVLSFAHSDNLNVFVSALQRFGTVRTLSSPRITVMNNQTAVLNVSESRVFFQFEVNRTDGTANTPPRVDITTEIKNVPEGIIITVQPSVDPDTKEITMNLRPSITRVVRSVTDPGAALASGGLVDNLIPELSIRELDSVVKMRSGSTIVMGGLMQDRSDTRQQGVPILSETPFIGPMFRGQRDGIRKTEMVIMLRAVTSDQPSPDDTDKDLYKKMTGDRHPLPM